MLVVVFLKSKIMIISVSKSVRQTRGNLKIGFSATDTIPRVFYTQRILDVIADKNHKEHFNIKYKFENGIVSFVKIFGNCNDFCKLMNTGGSLT
jgi:hypothetical protein